MSGLYRDGTPLNGPITTEPGYMFTDELNRKPVQSKFSQFLLMWATVIAVLVLGVGMFMGAVWLIALAHTYFGPAGAATVFFLEITAVIAWGITE